MKRYSLFILFFLFSAFTLTAQDEMFRTGRLDNGLTYYLRHTDLQAGQADFYLVQNVGALMEEENQNGLAHFLEHMAFNGTEHFPKGVQTFLRRRGVTRFNAYTGQDETVYHINNVPVQSAGLVDSCLLILRDWSGFLLLDPVEIDKERGVILEEKRLRQDVNSRLREQLDPYVYNGSKYATHNTIGKEEVIRNFTPEELRAYYTDWYRPDQQAVIVVGDIDVAKVEQEVKRLFGPIPPRMNPRPRVAYEIPDHSEPVYAKAFDRELPANTMVLMKRIRVTPPASLRDMMRDNLLQQFYTQIVYRHLSRYLDEEEADFMQAMVSVRKMVRHYDVMNIMVNPYPGKDREALRQLLTELERVHRFGLDSAALQGQVNQYLEGLQETEKNQHQLPNDVYVQLYENHFLEGKPVTTVAEDIALSREILAELTPADMRRWLERWQGEGNWVFVMQGNDPAHDYPSAEEITAMMQEARHAELSAVQAEARAVPLMDFEPTGGKVVKEKKLGKIGAEKWVLSNGCTVYFKPLESGKGEVSLLGESPGGKSLLAAADLPSAAAMQQLMMRSGLYTHDARTMEAILKNHRVALSVRLGEAFEGMRGNCATSEAEMLFQLIYLAFEKPRFDRDDFDKFLYLSKLEYRNAPCNVMDSVNEVVQNLRQEPSPRRWKEDQQFFDAMDYDRMLAVYRDRFQDASDFTFYIAGDLSREEAQRLAVRYLGALPSIYRKEKPVYTDFLRKNSFHEDITADIPGRKYMVNIEFYNRLRLKPREAVAMNYLKNVLRDRYMQLIREEHGGAYGVTVETSVTNFPSVRQFLGISFQSSLDKGEQMREIVFQQIDSVQQAGVSEEEISDIALLMNKPAAREEPTRNSRFWIEALRYYADSGKDLTRLGEGEKRPVKIRPSDLQAFARKFFGSVNCFDIVIKSLP